MTTFYHYTSKYHLDSIISDGAIYPTESNISHTKPHAGPDVVWLLDIADPSGDHGLYSELSLYDKREVCIEVAVPAIRWLNWQPALSMSQWWRDGLIEAGGGPESASHWYVWPASIGKRHWRSITVDGQPIKF